MDYLLPSAKFKQLLATLNLALLLLVSSCRPGVETATAPPPSPTPPPVTPSPTVPLPGDVDSLLDPTLILSEVARPATESEHFSFYDAGGFLPAELAQEAEEIYDYVTGRMQAGGPSAVDVIFLPPDRSPCPLRGLTAPLPPPEPGAEPSYRLLLFAGEETGRDQIDGVLAHELAHAVILHAGLAGNQGLGEGFASWGGGRYQTRWYGSASYDALVQGYLASERYLPLPQHEDLRTVYGKAAPAGESCLANRDLLYAQWASFTGYLIAGEGLELFWSLLESRWYTQGERASVQQPADYEGIYGQPLPELEAAWLAYLRAGEGGE